MRKELTKRFIVLLAFASAGYVGYAQEKLPVVQTRHAVALNLKKMVSQPAALSEASATKSTTTIDNVWEKDITDLSGYAQQEEDQRMIYTSDGNFIGFYTVGDGDAFYAAQVMKMDATGNQLWSKKIQLGQKTHAKKTV